MCINMNLIMKGHNVYPIGILHFIVILLVFPDFTASETLCNIEAVKGCLPGQSSLGPTSPFLDFQNLVGNCSTSSQQAVACLENVLKTCGSMVDKSVVAWGRSKLDILNYLCSPMGQQDYVSSASCISSSEVNTSMANCNMDWTNGIAMADTNGDRCSLFQSYKRCLETAVTGLCGRSASDFVGKVTSMSLRPLKEDYFPNCKEYSKGSNECSPNPCQNGGTCSSSYYGLASCLCRPGYEGTYCNTKTPDTAATGPCSPNPCQNGGKCSSPSGQSVCSCPPGYEGTLCERTTEQVTGLSVPTIAGLTVGVVSAFLLGICLTVLAICRLKRSSTTNKAGTVQLGQARNKDPENKPASPSPPTVHERHSPRPLPRLPLSEPSGQGEGLTHLQKEYDTYDPENGGYLTLYDENCHRGQSLSLPEYSYVRDMEAVMNTILSSNKSMSEPHEFPSSTTEVHEETEYFGTNP